MRVTKITFEQLFPTGPYANQRLGIEIDVTDSSPSDIVSHYQYAMDKVNSAFKALNTESNGYVQPIEPHQIPITQREKPSTIESLSQDISNAKDMAELDTFRLLASTNPTLKEAYDKKLQSLQNQ